MAAKNNSYVIGCKLPNGLVIRGAGKQVRLNGTRSQVIIGGFGITRDVPADVWEDFEKVHAQSNVIKNGVVFAVADDASAKSASEERSKVKTGFERLSEKDTKTKADS